jgi:hypothetical protein
MTWKDYFEYEGDRRDLELIFKRSPTETSDPAPRPHEKILKGYSKAVSRMDRSEKADYNRRLKLVENGFIDFTFDLVRSPHYNRVEMSKAIRKGLEYKLNP